MRYAIVIEKATNNYSAYIPDLPGCVATGATLEEIEEQIKEAIAFHLEGLCEAGYRVGTRQREDFPRAKNLLMPCPYSCDMGDGIGWRSPTIKLSQYWSVKHGST